MGPHAGRRRALLLLLLILLCAGASSRRSRAGAFGAASRSGGRGASSARGSKVAGAIAAGAAAGYGMGLLGRPRPARLGPGVLGARPAAASGFHAPSWPGGYGKRGHPSRAPRSLDGAPMLLLLLPLALCVARHTLLR